MINYEPKGLGSSILDYSYFYFLHHRQDIMIDMDAGGEALVHATINKLRLAPLIL